MSKEEFYFRGKVYVPKNDLKKTCTGCDLRFKAGCAFAMCSSINRKDGKDVIFVEKHP